MSIDEPEVRPAPRNTGPDRDLGADAMAWAQHLDVLREERDAARRRLDRIESSKAYRLALALTWFPRTLRAVEVRRRRARSNGRTAENLTDRGGRPGLPAAHGTRFFTSVALRGGIERVPNPDVTVVVPVFNSESWLDDCLSSILAQTDVSLELICVDDGSTDESREVLQRYAEQDPRVTIIEQENSGQSVARNVGLDVAVGRYVVYVDSDDFWSIDALRTLVQRADAEQLDVLLFDSFAFRDGEIDDTTWTRYSTYYQRSRSYGEVRPGVQMIADMRRRRDYRPHVCMYLARTAYVNDIGVRFIPGIVHQDNPYTFTLLLNATRTAHAAIDLYARRMRPGSTITSLHPARSAKGYYLSYLAMARAIYLREFPADVAEMLSEVVYGVFTGAHQAISRLPSAVRAELHTLDGAADAQVAFRTLTSTLPR